FEVHGFERGNPPCTALGPFLAQHLINGRWPVTELKAPIHRDGRRSDEHRRTDNDGRRQTEQRNKRHTNDRVDDRQGFVDGIRNPHDETWEATQMSMRSWSHRDDKSGGLNACRTTIRPLKKWQTVN